MPLTDPEFSQRVRKGLETIKQLTANFVGEHSYLGVIPGDKVDPEVLAYLENEETGILTRRFKLTAAQLNPSMTQKLVEFYRRKGGPELKPGMVIYEVRVDYADLTAMATGEANISRFVAGRGG